MIHVHTKFYFGGKESRGHPNYRSIKLYVYQPEDGKILIFDHGDHIYENDLRDEDNHTKSLVVDMMSKYSDIKVSDVGSFTIETTEDRLEQDMFRFAQMMIFYHHQVYKVYGLG